MAAANTERCYGVTNIKNQIPVILDENEHNYDAWRELLTTHCMAFDVSGHLDGTLQPANANDEAWHKRDGLVKLWLYGTMTQPLFRSCFQPGGTARDLWLRVENQFRNNKDAKAIQLDNELRTMEIGDMTVREYCQKMKSTAALLANVGTAVTDRTLVMYIINGLNDKFDNIINVIKHKEPFPSFESAKSMLESEETRLKKPPRASASHTATSSSSTALTTTSSQQPQVSNRNRNNIQRGNRRGGGNFNKRGRGNLSYNNWTSNPYWPPPPPPFWMPQFQGWPHAPRPPPISRANLVELPPVDEAYTSDTVADTSGSDWYMDSGASAHLATNPGMVQSNLNHNTGQSVIVGNGSSIPVSSIGSSFLHSKTKPLKLNNVLVTPHIVKNLISVRKFTRDNWCSVDFDPFGFTVKDLQSRQVLLRCDSSGELYSLPASFNKTPAASTALLASTPALWHKRLGHTNNDSLKKIFNSNPSLCVKGQFPVSCEPCFLGKSIKLPFTASNSVVSSPFHTIHSDLWTSPVQSISGIRYYVLFLDQFTHYLWVYPLRRKSEVFSKFLHFAAYVENQFQTKIKNFQCDNDGEFNNSEFHNYFASNGINARFSCPHTSQQNGRSERIIRTINNAVRTLLFQARLPQSFWVEALHAAVHILNITPSKSIQNQIPHTLLFQKEPSYEHLRVFGCLCFPNLNHSNLPKLSPRSTPCLFLGYPSQHRGYRCMDLKTNKIIISRHVYFDEEKFPAADPKPQQDPYRFLEVSEEPSPQFQTILQAPFTTSPTQPNISRAQTRPTRPDPLFRNPYTIQTRSKSGISKPKQVLSLLTKTKSPLPRSHIQALSDPNWNPAMTDEHGAMLKTKTWNLVPRPPKVNVVRSMWLFKHKYDADGVLSRHKARLVANGKSQEEGIDFNETFSPVVKPATIRTVLNVGVALNWPIHQLDVKNAFLQGDLEETVYMHQPPGFVDSNYPNHVCKLNKAIYGLKQAPRAWNSRFSNFLKLMGFIQSKADSSLFIFRKNRDYAYLLLYVDDILLTASTTDLLQRIINKLKSEFPMTDLGKLRHFLGIKADFNAKGLFLSQTVYAEDIITRAGMADCKPLATPVDLKSKLSIDDGEEIDNPTYYRKLAGALQYLTLTRPDISYAVHQVCLYMHNPRQPHLQALKRIIRYIKGTPNYGIQMVRGQIDTLTAYSDADWAGCPDTRRSTSGYCVFLGPNLISWSAKRQPTPSRSSSEAEYKGVANTVAELTWIRNLMMELHRPIKSASVVYCDNIGSVYLSTNPVKHQRTKHVELDIHFVRDKDSVSLVWIAPDLVESPLILCNCYGYIKPCKYRVKTQGKYKDFHGIRASQIPVILDENEHNYDAWRELLTTHCMAFDVSGHLDGTLQPANANDEAWHKRDGLVKLWLYGTMTQPLFRSCFQPGGTARDLWLRVENQFRNNKDAKAIQLDNELRTMEIGDMTVREYCQKMKSTAALLANVGTAVTDRTLVMYIINGLNDKFDNIINVIKHKEPFPSFESAKSMLESEETRLKKPPRASASHTATSSSSTALTTTSSQQPQVSNRNRNNIQRGNRRGGGNFNKRGRGNLSYNNWTSNPYWPPPPPPFWMPQFQGWPHAPRPPPISRANLVELPPVDEAYTSDTVADTSGSDWYMDSGASAHLATNPGSSKSASSSPM
ncbi:Ribonuclease H-like superfamily [Arabidopsis thaliana x Arabidopsis arenosa]|uniref:Ribonuclease H-like superfamily n=1 Tax=Arabidopsis thaliana x Arabidopsis arenosa TaxID=1240361 RepID=A0A8T1ZPA9_9BRAS|nr:Ribonuclease H-like superfamily [Arabidopsis thaliana x Arabidopsis arenosa]